MRDVKVKVSELKEKICFNRQKHIEEFNEAVDGYNDSVRAEIHAAIVMLRERIDELDEIDADKMIRLSNIRFDLEVPFNHEKDYDQVIEMLKMTVDTEVILKADEFACYVMDDWSWKKDFLAVSQCYKK